MSDHLDALKSIRQSQRVLSVVEEKTPLKKCPFCAEEIHYEAVKCKHCHEILSNPDIDKQGYVYLVQIENFLELKIVIPNWYKIFGNTKFFINNQEVTPRKLPILGKSKKQFLYELDSEKSLYIQNRTWGDPLPELYINEEKVTALGNLNWIQRIIAYAPIILVVQGGALGALCGIPAISLNCKILRLNTSPLMKVSFIFLAYILLAISYLGLALGFLAILYLFGYRG